MVELIHVKLIAVACVYRVTSLSIRKLISD